MEILTDRQKAVLDLFVQHWENGGPLPSHREIRDYFGFASPKASADHIMALKKKGFLMDDPDHSRGVRLTNKSMGIPILGEIPAGSPVQSEESTSEFLTLSLRNFGIKNRHNAFVLRVRGDSMIGRRIFDGDLVLVEKSSDCRNRDIVAALIDNESTLKTMIQKNGATWLRSENPKYPDLIPVTDLQIQGIARGVVRSFSS